MIRIHFAYQLGGVAVGIVGSQYVIIVVIVMIKWYERLCGVRFEELASTVDKDIVIMMYWSFQHTLQHSSSVGFM